MERYNINVDIKIKPVLDSEFTPLRKFNQAFLAGAKKPVSIAVERADKQMATTHTFIHGTDEMAAADNYYIDRLVKTLLWMKGGFRVYVNDKEIYDYLNSVYCIGGEREFDFKFMANVFDHPFEVVLTENVPESMDLPKPIGGHPEGCRIGFDAGGSDRKVSAVIDGETVTEKYFKLAPRAGIVPDADATPAQKLKAVQNLMEADDERAAKVFHDIGVYLGHTLAYYYENYGFKYVLLLGRTMSGKGGDLLLATCKKVLEEEYPEVDVAIRLTLPDEKFRRVGQSMAAASQPASK